MLFPPFPVPVRYIPESIPLELVMPRLPLVSAAARYQPFLLPFSKLPVPQVAALVQLQRSSSLPGPLVFPDPYLGHWEY